VKKSNKQQELDNAETGQPGIEALHLQLPWNKVKGEMKQFT